MKNNISSQIYEQLPDFVQEDHALFGSFLTAYYEYLEETGNVLDFIERFDQNLDLAQMDDGFADAFYNELCGTFPKKPLIEKRRLINHIKEFYLAKGSEQSFQFMFTVLFGEKVYINYPRIYIQKASESVYRSENIVYTTANNLQNIIIDNTDLNASIEGVTTKAFAIVDTIEPIVQNGQFFYKIKLSSYDNEFDYTEDVKIVVDDRTFFEAFIPTINEVSIANGGKGYKINDEVYVTSPDNNGEYFRASIKQVSKGSYTEILRGDNELAISPSNSTGSNYAVGDVIYANPTPNSYGYGFLAEVAQVDGGGAIEKIRVFDYGYDYIEKTTVNIVSENGTGADIVLDGDIGEIIKIQIDESGLNYPLASTVSVQSDTGTGFSGTLVFESIYNKPNAYTSSDHFLSATSKLQDSYYYQQFSYVVDSVVRPNLYYDVVKSNAHPVGSQMFPLWKIEDFQDISVDVLSENEQALNNLTVIKDTESVALNIGIESGSYSYIPIIQAHTESATSLGLTLCDLDTFKFDPNFDAVIADFKDYTVGDFDPEVCGIYSIDYQPNSDITIL